MSSPNWDLISVTFEPKQVLPQAHTKMKFSISVIKGNNKTCLWNAWNTLWQHHSSNYLDKIHVYNRYINDWLHKAQKIKQWCHSLRFTKIWLIQIQFDKNLFSAYIHWFTNATDNFLCNRKNRDIKFITWSLSSSVTPHTNILYNKRKFLHQLCTCKSPNTD